MKSKLSQVAILLFVMIVSTIFSENINQPSAERRLKILHLTFHTGTQKEIEAVAKKLSFDLETWYILASPRGYFDGISGGNAVYNITHDRAERVWNLHKDYFDQFDAIITSDTAPLARIFLQNNWKKPLIIWICNRFDYHDGASLDGPFPDQEFYDLFRQASKLDNVTIVAWTAFEHHYAKSKGVDTGSLVITPCAPNLEEPKADFVSLIPSTIEKKDCFFLPPYHNETIYMNLSAFCNGMGIPNFCGRYNGPFDIKDFKGIIHLPYSWSNSALFENISLGIPYFIPSEKFFSQLATQGNYFHPSLNCLLSEGVYGLSEWYCEEHKEVLTYFDSWDDLKEKILTADYPTLREKSKAFSEKRQKLMLERWQEVLINKSKLINTTNQRN